MAMSPLGRKLNVDFIDEDDSFEATEGRRDIGYDGYNQKNVYYNRMIQQLNPRNYHQPAPRDLSHDIQDITLGDFFRALQLIKKIINSRELKWGLW